MLITEQALIARLRRYHRRQQETFRVARSDRFWLDLGCWYVTDDQTGGLNVALHTFDALVDHSREVGVLWFYEDVH